MEIISVEKKTFEALILGFGELLDAVEALCSKQNDKRLAKWYDNQDVCTILKICPRTLQTLRDNGTLPFTKEGRKIWYKPSDVEALLENITL